MLGEFVFAIYVLSVASPCYAQNPECDPALFRDIYNDSFDHQSSVRVLDLIDENNYRELKRAMGGDAAFPVDGVPVKFGATYAEFSASRSSFFSSHQLERDEQASRSMFQNHFSSASGSAYQACLDASASIGIHVRAEELQDTGGAIRVRFQGPPGDTRSLTLTVTKIIDDRPETTTVENYVLPPNSVNRVI